MTMRLSVLLPALLAALPAGAADRPYIDPICALASDLDRLTGYDVAPGCPEITFTLPPDRGAQFTQVGAFDPATGAIALAADLDVTSVFGRSVLLHELVHAAQQRAGKRYRCPAQREAEAYRVQSDYLRAMGELEEANTVMILGVFMSQCGDPYD